VLLSLDKNDLSAYLGNQVGTFFPDRKYGAEDLRGPVAEALARLEYCFSHIRLKYFFEDGETLFNHLNTDQYAAFLYFTANTIFRNGGNLDLAARLYALNKLLHAFDLFYEVEMPKVFYLQHPVGSILGRAQYGNFFCVYHGVSIGSNLDDVAPVMGDGLLMFGGSRLIGDSTLGDNCIIAPGAIVMDRDVPENTVTHGMPPNTQSKPSRRHVIRDIFNYHG